ncbi:unnamed protein product [Amoebophrya sp. A25]|nr:unnamed protein product [Amoebophrya sp. A25]|eukprot:GSA25T00004384001.1
MYQQYAAGAAAGGTAWAHVPAAAGYYGAAAAAGAGRIRPDAAGAVYDSAKAKKGRSEQKARPPPGLSSAYDVQEDLATADTTGAATFATTATGYPTHQTIYTANHGPTYVITPAALAQPAMGVAGWTDYHPYSTVGDQEYQQAMAAVACEFPAVAQEYATSPEQRADPPPPPPEELQQQEQYWAAAAAGASGNTVAGAAGAAAAVTGAGLAGAAAKTKPRAALGKKTGGAGKGGPADYTAKEAENDDAWGAGSAAGPGGNSFAPAAGKGITGKKSSPKSPRYSAAGVTAASGSDAENAKISWAHIVAPTPAATTEAPQPVPVPAPTGKKKKNKAEQKSLGQKLAEMQAGAPKEEAATSEETPKKGEVEGVTTAATAADAGKGAKPTEDKSHAAKAAVDSASKRAASQSPGTVREDVAMREKVIDHRAQELAEQAQGVIADPELRRKEKDRELRRKQREAAERFRKEASAKRQAADEERAEVRRKKKEDAEKKKPTLFEAMQTGGVPPHADPNAKKPGVLFQQPAATGHTSQQTRAAPGFMKAGFDSPSRVPLWFAHGTPPGFAAYYQQDGAYQQDGTLQEPVYVESSGEPSKNGSVEGGDKEADLGSSDEYVAILRGEVPLEKLYQGGEFEYKDEFESHTFDIPAWTKPGTKLVQGSQSLIVTLTEEDQALLDGEDLHLKNCPIDFYTALLGGTCKANVFGEDVSLAIPKMVRDGDLQVYPGLGWAKEGRLIVTFEVGDPPSDWAETRAKWAEVISHSSDPAKEAAQPEK